MHIMIARICRVCIAISEISSWKELILTSFALAGVKVLHLHKNCVVAT